MLRKYSAVLVRIIPVMLSLLVSCKGDDAQEPVPTPQTCLLRRVTFVDGICTITHNDKGLPVRLDFTYSNSTINRSTIIEYDAADNVVKLSQEYSYVQYEYNAENKVIWGGVFYRKNATELYNAYHLMEYTYNDQGYIDSVIYDSNRYERFEYDASGNLIKSYGRTDHKPEALMTEYLEFDDKKNPKFEDYYFRYTIYSSTLVYITGLRIPFVGEHNLVSKNVLLVDGSMTNYTNEFEYNELGYPKSAKQTISKPEQSYTSQFHYDCK